MPIFYKSKRAWEMSFENKYRWDSPKILPHKSGPVGIHLFIL
jgi:hypothetical protein